MIPVAEKRVSAWILSGTPHPPYISRFLFSAVSVGAERNRRISNYHKITKRNLVAELLCRSGNAPAWNRTIETVKFYLALTRAGIPVYLIEAHTLADRLAEKEWIGIVPDGVMPAYCESWFPNEHIIDYMNLPYDDREKFLPFCVWYDEEPIKLVTEKEAEPK